MYTPDSLVKMAVDQIVDHIKQGDSAHDATVKVAREMGLNHNFIKRSSEAINVALHHSHFSKNPTNKAAEFETVDAQKVAEEIYGVKEKTASEFRSELFSSFQYPETAPKFARYLEEGPYRDMYQKMASVDEITKFAMSEKGVYEKSSNYIRDLKKVAYDKEAEAMDAKFQVDNSFCNILRKFAQDDFTRSSWDKFETAVYSKHGEASVGYLDLLYKAAKLTEPRGAHDANIKLANACPEAALYDTFVDNVAKYATAQTESDDAVHNYNFENDYMKQAFAERGSELHKEAEDIGLLDRVEKSIAKSRTKAAQVDDVDPVIAAIAEKEAANLGEFDGRIKSAVDLIDMATGGGSGWLKGQGKPSLSANTNSGENNRNRAFLLQELISTDPIISKFPTHQTVDAYQQLLRIAPELSNEKEITRAFLRQAGASQAIDPFQAEQLISANNNLFKQHQMQRGLGGAPTPGGDK